jgi:hypothetical protein
VAGERNSSTELPGGHLRSWRGAEPTIQHYRWQPKAQRFDARLLKGRAIKCLSSSGCEPQTTPVSHYVHEKQGSWDKSKTWVKNLILLIVSHLQDFSRKCNAISGGLKKLALPIMLLKTHAEIMSVFGLTTIYENKYFIGSMYLTQTAGITI